MTDASGSRSSMVQPHLRLTSFFGMRKHRSLIVGIKEILKVLNSLKIFSQASFLHYCPIPIFQDDQYLPFLGLSGVPQHWGVTCVIGRLSAHFRLSFSIVWPAKSSILLCTSFPLRKFYWHLLLSFVTSAPILSLGLTFILCSHFNNALKDRRENIPVQSIAFK